MDAKSFLAGVTIGAVALVGNAIVNYRIGLEHGHKTYWDGFSMGVKIAKKETKTEK